MSRALLNIIFATSFLPCPRYDNPKNVSALDDRGVTVSSRIADFSAS